MLCLKTELARFVVHSTSSGLASHGGSRDCVDPCWCVCVAVLVYKRRSRRNSLACTYKANSHKQYVCFIVAQYHTGSGLVGRCAWVVVYSRCGLVLEVTPSQRYL